MEFVFFGDLENQIEGRMIAIIAGATGLTGTALIRRLVNDSRITRIRALVRTPGKIQNHEKIEEIGLPPRGFSELLTNPDSRLSGEVYFCTLGTTIRKAGSQAAFRRVDLDAVVAFAKLCESRKGRFFALVSAAGANSRSRIFYSRVKGDAEEAILKLAIPRVVIARPSLLIGKREEVRPAEKLGIRLFNVISPALPHALRSRLGTPVDLLGKHLIEQALKNEPGSLILESPALDA